MPRPKRLAAINAASKLRSTRNEHDEHDDVEADVNAENDEMHAIYTPDDNEDDNEPVRPAKRRRTGRNSTQTPAVNNNPSYTPTPPITPQRRSPNHPPTYHHPLLLTHPPSRNSLLSWFDSVSSHRSMPWRKPWINPSTHPDAILLREALKTRAYEVYISEIMLQQTRVETVKSYWTNWMARWPTIHDLAAAEPDDVLSAWRGLGYYTRAGRIHAAAVVVCEHPLWQGLIPDDVGQLEKCLPGVGRYTAGAISAIVYGMAEPMVDGNVLRVLSRQLGIYGDVKADKVVVDRIWACANALVRQVARDGTGGLVDGEGEGEVELSDRPGRWGQALMELGSTVCMPKPACSKCPITATCRAYSEGYALAVEAGEVKAPENGDNGSPAARLGDIEDICDICDDFEEDVFELLEDADLDVKEGASQIRSPFFTTQPQEAPTNLTPKALATIINHAKKYPLKKPKKKIGEQESLVCAIRRSSDGRYLLQRRPPKGLLANLWEFPSHTFPAQSKSKSIARSDGAMRMVARSIIHDSELLISPKKQSLSSEDWSAMVDRSAQYRHAGELGIIPWTFSHLKLTMYVQLFELRDDLPGTKIVWAANGARQKWATREEIEAESMGTGMRKCWDLVKKAEDDGLRDSIDWDKRVTGFI